MRKEWVVTFTTTATAVNSPKRKKILNIYSGTVQRIIERGMICWETTFLIHTYLAQTPEIGQGLGRFLSCGARKQEQT